MTFRVVKQASKTVLDFKGIVTEYDSEKLDGKGVVLGPLNPLYSLSITVTSNLVVLHI